MLLPRSQSHAHPTLGLIRWYTKFIFCVLVSADLQLSHIQPQRNIDSSGPNQGAAHLMNRPGILALLIIPIGRFTIPHSAHIRKL